MELLDIYDDNGNKTGRIIERGDKSVKLSKLSFLYRMVNQDCILVCTTVSEHSFLSKEVSFVNLKNDFPVFFALSKEQLTLE